MNDQRNTTVKKNTARSIGGNDNNKNDYFGTELRNLQKRHEEDRKRVEKIKNELRR